jgi:aminobenzoyl-glutamate transport protein
MSVERIRHLFANVILLLIVAELLLVFASWLWAATTTTEGVRSLISEEGVRWLFGNFTDILSGPWLVHLLLLSMAGGNLWRSGLLRMSSKSYRGRLAIRLTIITFLLFVVVLLLLIAVPHAILLSATGAVFPSPFSRAIVPLFSLGVVLVSTVHGWASGRYVSFADIVGSWSYGISQAAPLFVLYVLLMQLYKSLLFVFLYT